MHKQRLLPAEHPAVQRAVSFRSETLFRILAISACPVLRRFQEGSVAVGTGVFQRLLVLAVFVAGVVEEGLDGLAGLVLLAVSAGDVAFGQTAFLHFTSGPAQVPRTVQIPLFATLAGILKFTAGLAVGAAATNFVCGIHRDELPSVR